ncbi:uncharacterized protein LOC131618790 [Vicia villosa]|uniref:uncharacterized protein LOC131618790 n=1 Tax=Vicia villosa TaxID=3911 RepID=UPI00273C915B|nr:uncharacterized protein LOC131618790 [Vicia villosa]
MDSGFSRPRLDGLDFPLLSSLDSQQLEASFSLEEIKGVVWECDGDKCPGPDGFNFNFLRKCWEIVEKDVFNFVSEFHGKENIPKAISASFIALIPKCDNPQWLHEFCPISLVTSLYKILAKLMANRLKKCIGKLISGYQTAFVPGRQIQDGVLVLNEVIDLAKRSGQECCILKVDFAKAYDNVSWDFLFYVLRMSGFGVKWISWIKACIYNCSMSVLVNGSPTSEFPMGKGLRQGDPLSPFLFTLVAEGLAKMMDKAIHLGLFKGFKINEETSFHLLQFADDTVVIGDGSWSNIRRIKVVLRGFELVSGLYVNLSKSNLYGVNLKEDKGNLIGVLKELIRIQREFLWGGGVDKVGIAWVGWDEICKSKKEGGLGVRCLLKANDSLLCKWKWRFLVEEDVIWQKLLVHRYGVLELIGCGSRVMFWRTRWIGGQPLCITFPHLYEQVMDKEALVSVMGCLVNSVWLWDFPEPAENLVGEAAEQLAELNDILSTVTIRPDAKDSFVWFHQGEATYSVSGGYSVARSCSNNPSLNAADLLAVNQIWNTQVPSKIHVFGWRCIKDRIATREQLLKRGILINFDSNVCPLCNRFGESLLHLLVQCSFAVEVWKLVCMWTGISVHHSDSLAAHLFSFTESIGSRIPVKKRLLIWLVCCWSLWCMQNAVIFKNEEAVVADVFEKLRLLSWQWLFIGNNFNGPVSFYFWCHNPLDSMIV